MDETQDSNEKQQEILFKLSMFEQQIQQLQQQIGAVEQGMVELKTLNSGLNNLKGKEGEEIFAPIGKGIFAKAKLLSEELIMDVGSKNFIKKSIPETQKVIEEQLKKLEEVKEELNKNMDDTNEEARKLIGNVQEK